MDERNLQMFNYQKSKFCGAVQEVFLPDFPNDDNTVTTTVTKSRRVSFGTNFVKEFIVDAAVSAQCVSEYEQDLMSSDSSNANSSYSAVESGVLDQSTFRDDIHKGLKIVPPKNTEPDESRSKIPKFASTICFSSDSPSADMEFTEGCITLAKSILDKKDKEMTLIIQAKPKEPKDKGKIYKEDETKHFDGSQVDMSVTRCLKSKENRREERRFESENTKIFSRYENEMSITRCDKLFGMRQSDDESDDNFKENQIPLDMIMRHLDKDNSDLEKQIFNPEKSFSDLLNFSNESEKLNLNESMEISRDFEPNFFKVPDPPPQVHEDDSEPLPAVNSSDEFDRQVLDVNSQEEKMDISTDLPPSFLATPEEPEKLPVLNTSDDFDRQVLTCMEDAAEDKMEVTMEMSFTKTLQEAIPVNVEQEKELEQVDEFDKQPVGGNEVIITQEEEMEVTKPNLFEVLQDQQSPQSVLEEEERKETEVEEEEEKPEESAVVMVNEETRETEELQEAVVEEENKELDEFPQEVVEEENKGLDEFPQEVVEERKDLEEFPTAMPEQKEPEEELQDAIVVEELRKQPDELPPAFMEEERKELEEFSDVMDEELPEAFVGKEKQPEDLSVAVMEEQRKELEEFSDAMEEELPKVLMEDERQQPEEFPRAVAEEDKKQLEELPVVPVEEETKELEQFSESMEEELPGVFIHKETKQQEESPKAVIQEETNQQEELPTEVVEKENSFKNSSPPILDQQEQQQLNNIKDMTEEVEEEREPPLADTKAIENLKEQSKEPGCLWSLKDLRYPQPKKEGLLSFNLTLLESTTTVRFSLKMPNEDSLDSCSVISKGEISLTEDEQLKLPDYNLVLDFGFQKTTKHFEEGRKKVKTIRHVSYFMDQMNLFTSKINSYLRQVYSILTLYPGSRLTGSTLSFRLFSFPIFFSSTLSIDLTDLFRLSDSCLSFEMDFGQLNQKAIREIFYDCLKRDDSLVEFVIRSTKYLIDVERESGRISKRKHIRLLPDELKL